MRRPENRAREAAESLAVQALNFLATEPARLSRFLDTTGLDPASIRQAAAEPDFLAGVLAHLGEDDALLKQFAAAEGGTPTEADRARHLLAGGDWQREMP